jgi:hypothetical protein
MAVQNFYDQASRYLAKVNPVGFFHWLAARFLARYEFRRWLDTSQIAFPGEPDRICDTVAEFTLRTDPDERRILDVEFQAEPDPDMLERQGEYAFRLRRELRHAPGPKGKCKVISVLVNLTGPAQPQILDMTEEDLDGAGTTLKVLLRTLREEDAAATLTAIAAGQLDRCVLPWIPLMRGACEWAIIKEWRRLAEQEPNSRLRADYGGLALVFAELTGHAAAWRKGLKGWNVKQSPQILEWQAEARKEGRKEGEVIGQQASLLRVLKTRFQKNVPAKLAAVIKAQDDLEELARWLDVALTVDSLDAFHAAVQI